MPATIQFETNHTYVLRLSGTLLRSELARVQDASVSSIEAGIQPRLLTILENFSGWEAGADWGDLEFLYWHGNDIARIAIVGEARWESDALAFAGAGFRKAPVKFFPFPQLAEARAWLEA